METIDEVVMEVCNSMTPKMDDKLLAELKQTLYIKLNTYNVERKSTELTVCSDMKLLTMFAQAKLLEGKSENTIQRYVDIIRPLLQTVNKDISQIETNDIRCYLYEYKKQRGISDRTADGMRRIYSSFFAWLFAEKYIPENPMLRITPIKFEKKIKKVINDEELELLRMTCKNKRDIAIIDTLYSTGVRVSELINLDINDVDFDAKK